MTRGNPEQKKYRNRSRATMPDRNAAAETSRYFVMVLGVGISSA
jgi:hypothetical protein